MKVKDFVSMLACVDSGDYESDGKPEMTVNQLINALADYSQMDKTLTQEMMRGLTDNRYTIEFDGEDDVVERPLVNKTRFFCEVAKQICFRDCGDYEIKDIHWNGKQYWYQGWEPGMVYRFVSEDGDEWVGRFPEWDH